MAVHEHTRHQAGFRLRSWNKVLGARVGSTDAVAANPAVVARSPAVVRIATAFIFLWAFLDKASGRHYATGDTWGLGRIWARIPLASHNRWLL